ncbi:archease [Microbulbifer pacificus]|uniref:Archease n=1 Tax=Microbulbifer pacificus TaxID=407164 RepID=A0AAU0N123_9GAMM|nr:archease [Microbulbifer pacificus]WOX05936.1 archease [Microbulbifer pacificus]
MRAHWAHFSHQADMGLRGTGATLAQAFEQAALALTATVTELETVAPQLAVAIECDCSDPELLLVDWLNALVYEMATRHMLFSRFEITIRGGRLSATAWGEKVDRHKHAPAVEVKGATYTALNVAQRENGDWVAQCVVDI